MKIFTAILRKQFQELFKRRAKRLRTCSSPDCGYDPSIRQRLWRLTPSVRLHGSVVCFPECLERELLRRLQHASTAPPREQVNSCRVPLGLLMLSRGELTSEQLHQALELQKKNGTGRIGEWLQQLGHARDVSVAAALASQWSCPVIKTVPAGVGSCTIPFYLLKIFRMVPVHFSNDRRRLHMAFADKIEYRALLAIEQMMDCKTEACLTTRGELEVALGRMEEQTSRAEKFFEGASDPAETTRIISSYVSTLNATEIRLASCGELLWARITGDEFCENLLFSRIEGKVLQFVSKKLPETIPS
jgi:hypothetical protein